MNVHAVHAACQQHEEADDLPADGCQGSARDSHSEAEDQQRIQCDIQDGAAEQSYHGIHRAPLVPELVVDDELPHHEGRSEDDDPQITHRLFYRASPGPEKFCQLPDIQDRRCCHDDAQDHGQRKPRGSHLFRFFLLPCAQHPGKIVARTLSAEKPQSLDHRHRRKSKSHSRRRLCGDPSDKERIRRVVDRCHQHADDRRYAQAGDEPGHRRLRHIPVSLCRLRICIMSHRNAVRRLLQDALSQDIQKCCRFRRLLQDTRQIPLHTISPFQDYAYGSIRS